MAAYTWAELRKKWPELSQFERLDKARAEGHTVIRPGAEPPGREPQTPRGGGTRPAPTGSGPLDQGQVTYRAADGSNPVVNYPDIQAEIQRLQRARRHADAQALIRAADAYENRYSRASAEHRSAEEERIRNEADAERIANRKKSVYAAIAKASGLTVKQLQDAAKANPTIATLIRRIDRDARSQTAYAHKEMPKNIKELGRISAFGKRIRYAQPSGDTTHEQWRADNPQEVARRAARTAARDAYNQRARDAYNAANTKGSDDDEVVKKASTNEGDGTKSKVVQGEGTTNTNDGEEDNVPAKVKQTVKQQIMASPVFAQFLNQMADSSGMPADTAGKTTRRDLMNTIFSADFRSKVADMLVARRLGLGSKAYTDAYNAIINTKIGDTKHKFFSRRNLIESLNRAGLGVENPSTNLQKYLSSMPGVDGADPIRSFAGLDWLKSFQDIMEAQPTRGLGNKWLDFGQLHDLEPEKFKQYIQMVELMGKLGYDYNPGGAIEPREVPEPLNFAAEDFDPQTLTNPDDIKNYLNWRALRSRLDAPATIDWATFDPSTATNTELSAMLERQKLLSDIEELRGGPEAGQGTDTQPILSPNVDPDGSYTQVGQQGTGGYMDSAQAGWQTSDQFNPLYQPDHMTAENNLHGGSIGGRY